jgi:hypothetical protein
MTNRVFLTIARMFDGAGEAIRTPAGVNVDLLRSYGPRDENGMPDLYGNEIAVRRD